jgi:hypothetical protein
MLVLVGEEEEEEEIPIITLPTQRVRCWKTRTTSELPFPSLPFPSHHEFPKIATTQTYLNKRRTRTRKRPERERERAQKKDFLSS